MAGHEPRAVGQELRDAFRLDQANWLNLTYGTRDGHFGYIQTGMCPLRGNGPYNMLGVDDGTQSKPNWQGRVPFDELPQVHDPASGWLQSCNTAANYVTDGPYAAGRGLSARASCAGTMLPTAEHGAAGAGVALKSCPRCKSVTLEQARAFALDTFAPAGPIWVKPLCALTMLRSTRFPTRI